MTRQVHVSEATITTAEVTIKALTIGKRQVTQAVFKQLQDEPLINEDICQFCGVPWGIVNYRPAGECPSTRIRILKNEVQHLHVVWQLGTQLRRSSVPSFWPAYRPAIRDVARSAGYLYADRLPTWQQASYGILDPDPATEEYIARLLEHPRYKRLVNEWFRRYYELSQLDQLFVAV
ncbi:MAG: hypothetical protein M3120_01385 [Pseudomonadota bacterium]|nr:hypothetical protein [Pseudomonadota bacterium]